MKKLHNELEKIYREHKQQLFTCALAVTRCAARAEDAVHDAFCRLFRLKRGPKNLKVYVFRAVRNAAIDQLRRNPSPLKSRDEFIFDPNDGPREAMAKNEFREIVEKSLLNLNEHERETIVQHLYAGLTFREIAAVLKRREATVAAWYYRGLKKLRTQLEKDYEEGRIETEKNAVAKIRR